MIGLGLQSLVVYVFSLPAFSQISIVGKLYVLDFSTACDYISVYIAQITTGCASQANLT